MSVKAVDTKIVQNNNLNNRQVAFKGSFNPVVTLMDGIEKGGFAASFIAQDGVGMVIPRIYEGLNRNRERDENGKKTGPLNWEFARREGIREMLSGPSVFLIPLGILSLVKKYSGPANNVRVDHIKALGDEFAEFVSQNPDSINDLNALKKGYYKKVFENVLTNSLDGNNNIDISKKAERYASHLIDIENSRANGKKKNAKFVKSQLIDDYLDLRKSSVSPSVNNNGAVISVKGTKLNTNIESLTQSISDYTNDVLHKISKHKKDGLKENVVDYITKFNKHRAGTRVLTNFGMFGAIVGFYALIPKLYNWGLKHDPGLKGLENQQDETSKKETEKNENGKNVSFQGFGKLGETALNSGHLGKFFNKFEFNGASISLPGMLGLLFGFCLPTRYSNAKSDKEKKEILVRDLFSFTAILFFAKALSRAFSGLFAKISGMALNIKPQNHNGFFNKFKNYFTAGSGIEVLSSNQIVSKYSGIDKYKDKIIGFFDLIKGNDGDIKKVLKIDENVGEAAENIVKQFSNKSIQESSLEEIYSAFRKAEGSKELEQIYKILSAPDNKLVTRAKTLNSLFGFTSTIILVPLFMMWLARFCEKMTKRAVEKEKLAETNKSFTTSEKVSMNEFLKK